MTKLTEGVSRQAVKCEPSTPRPAPPPATIANKAHVFTEDQNTMEWYIDGIPIAELKRRYGAHDALVEALKTIALWELPNTGRKWPDGKAVSYEVDHGSHGAKDYIRQVAFQALAVAAEVRNG